MKKLQKIIVDGEERNKCPICGDAVNVSAWNKWKMCLHCHKLTEQGIDFEKCKRIRFTEKSGELDIKENTEQPEPLEQTETFDELNPTYNKNNIYNFRTTFPAGVRIVTRDKNEAKYLQEVYSYFSHYGNNIPEFNVLISGILQAKLDLLRNSQSVSEEETPYHERKGIKEIDIKLGDQINKTVRVLEDLKDRVDSQSGNIITTKFGAMLQYLHEHGQEYMGIGICKECNHRVIFKTNFPTFKTWMLEKLEEIEGNINIEEKLDKKSIQIFANAIRAELNDNSLAKTYVVEHMRQLESSMIETGSTL